MEEDRLMKELEEAKATLIEVIETEVVSQPPEVEQKDPFLEEAVKNGYNPNYEGPDKKTPEQYVRDGSFFKKISAQKKEINELKDAVRDLISKTTKAEQLGYEKAFRELQTQKETAIEEGDVTRVRQIDQELDSLKEELSKPVPSMLEDEVKSQEVHHAATEFKSKNATWFGKYDSTKPQASMTEEEKENLEMTEAALVYDDYLGRMVAEGRGNYTPEQAVRMVEERIRKYYPHRFDNPKKAEPMAVGKPSIGSSSVTTTSLQGKLTDRQKQQYELYSSIDPKFGSLEDYAKFLSSIGELK